MAKSSIVVVGSSNTDMVVKATHLPQPGETVLGGSFFMNPGGKGANQAVAAARLGGNVSFIAKVGNDVFGHESKTLFDKEGIDTSFVFTDVNHPSGVALITVNQEGENCIVVASGANAALLPEDIEPAVEIIKNAAVVLMQLETPLVTIEYVSALAKQNGATVLLNPAPACALNEHLLKNISIITPNQKEAEMLCGVKVVDRASAENAARALNAKGIQTIVITLGSQGALLFDNELFHFVPVPKVKAVDTTAAGDVFSGALAVAIAEGMQMPLAIAFACEAASISVTRLGAQASAPYRNEISMDSSIQ